MLPSVEAKPVIIVSPQLNYNSSLCVICRLAALSLAGQWERCNAAPAHNRPLSFTVQATEE